MKLNICAYKLKVSVTQVSALTLRRFDWWARSLYTQDRKLGYHTICESQCTES